MKTEDIRTLLNGLGCGKITVSVKWVRAQCPFAAYLHQKGEDKSPSFAISITPGGESKYRCLSCNKKGSLLDMIQALKYERRKHLASVDNSELDRLGNWIAAHNAPSAKSIKDTVYGAKAPWDAAPAQIAGVTVGHQTAMKLKLEEPPPLPEDVLSKFIMPAGAGLDWLRVKKPQVAWKTLDAWEVRWQPTVERLAIPIRRSDGQLVGVSGRRVHEESKPDVPGEELCPCGEAHEVGQNPKFLHSNGFKRDFYLYGEHKLKHDTFGVLTEGFFDVQFLWQNRYNAFAIMGSYLSELQVEKCLKWFTEVLIFPDNDKAGLLGAKANADVLQKRGMKCRVLVPLEGKTDPDDHTAEDLLALLGPPNLS